MRDTARLSFAGAVALGSLLLHSGCEAQQPATPPSPTVRIQLKEAALVEDLRKVSFPKDAPVKVDLTSKAGDTRGNLQVSADFELQCRNGSSRTLTRLNLGLYSDPASQTWRVRSDVILQMLREAADACSK
jgi:hypothetical protein